MPLLGYVDAVKCVERINEVRQKLAPYSPAPLAPWAYLALLQGPEEQLQLAIGGAIATARHDADTMRRWAKLPRSFRRQMIATEAGLPVFYLRADVPPVSTPESWPISVDTLPDCLRSKA